MRRVSRKAAALQRQHRGARQDYLVENERCMICRTSWATQVHEIARGQSRAEAFGEPACWLGVCGECHAELDDYGVWPIVRQLAAKLVRDPENFDIAVVNTVRGRAPNSITLVDVAEYLEVS
jgi:hypothetical protein